MWVANKKISAVPWGLEKKISQFGGWFYPSSFKQSDIEILVFISVDNLSALDSLFFIRHG